MAVLVAAQNLVTLFVGIELLSIPLYVLCASELQREKSLESGLKYLIIGSVGSATLLYGLALVYGATGSTDFGGIAASLGRNGETIAGDPLMLTGIGLAIVGFGFKASVAPFHQWTPDVYEGAPSPVTAFMSVATKAAAFGVFLRFMDVAVIDEALVWQPIVAALAAITIIVGNVGALAQTSVKRILAWSSVAQGGYLLVGIVVSSAAGLEATLFYLIVYVVMNLAAFSVVVARERETANGDSLHAFAGLGATRPVLAWPMTIAMLSLAGIPATAGFVGKLNLISASVDGDYAWLGVLIAIGSAISLGLLPADHRGDVDAGAGGGDASRRARAAGRRSPGAPRRPTSRAPSRRSSPSPSSSAPRRSSSGSSRRRSSSSSRAPGSRSGCCRPPHRRPCPPSPRAARPPAVMPAQRIG